MAANSYDFVLENIKSSLDQITVDDCGIQPVIQRIEISSEDQSDLRLLEIDNEIYGDLLRGKTLCIRGEEKDTAVLCTDFKTYELKEAEISTPLPVLSGLTFPDSSLAESDQELITRQIVGIFHSYYELIPSSPRFKKLYSLLNKCPYQGEVFEEPELQKYTRNDLLKRVQASEAELTEALRQMDVCVIGGYVRMIECNFKYEMVSRMINAAESESVPLDRVPKKCIRDALEDLYVTELLEHCFTWFTSDTGDVTDDGDVLCAFKEDKICRLFAETLLKPFSKFSLQDFLESWQKSVPEGMTTNLSQLEGLALIDRSSKPEVIIYLPVEEMQENVQDRLNTLFKIKPKWTYQEIHPYIRDQESPTVSCKAILLKYCRSFTENDIEIFCSKWYISTG